MLVIYLATVLPLWSCGFNQPSWRETSEKFAQTISLQQTGFAF